MTDILYYVIRQAIWSYSYVTTLVPCTQLAAESRSHFERSIVPIENNDNEDK